MKELIGQQRATAASLKQTKAVERPGYSLPYAQRFVNPFLLANSGNAAGDFLQRREITVRAFNCAVFVLTTNNATNFWIAQLKDVAGNTIASFSTAAIAPNVWARFPPGIVAQPIASNVVLTVTMTATLSPGAIFIVPEVIALL